MADIDWREVLGPLLSSPPEDRDGVITSDDLPILTEAIGRHSDRAVRVHPSIDSGQLPLMPRRFRGSNAGDGCKMPSVVPVRF